VDEAVDLNYVDDNGFALVAQEDPDSPDEVKEERWHRFMKTQQAISARRLKRKVGSRQQVIIDEAGPTVAKGRSMADAPEIDGAVYVASRRPLRVGEIATVKIERAGGLMHLARDVGRVQSKAGTRAALDGLKVAESPREMAQVAKLAEKEGGKTRAILKTLGRGAIALTLATFDLGLWILGALLTVFTFVSALKSATERGTQRVLNWRKNVRRRRSAATAAI
jgi:hypothetical protein